MIETPNLKLQKYELDDAANLADGYNNSMDILDATVHGIEGKFPITSAEIEDGTINTVDIANGAITEIKLAADAVTAEKLAPESVATSTIVDAAVITSKIADAAVTAAKLAEGVISNISKEQLAPELSQEIGNNTTLVEEHVNYFTDLEITDDASAQAVNTKINNAFQGSISNTSEIESINQMLTTLNQSIQDLQQKLTNEITWVLTPISPVQQITDVEVAMTFAHNLSNTAIKLFGKIYNGTGTTKTTARTLIPGVDGTPQYGVKYNLDTGLRPEKARFFTNLGITFYPDKSTEAVTVNKSIPSNFALGTDGYIYLFFTSSSADANIRGGEYEMFYQCTLYLSPSDWPTDNEQLHDSDREGIAIA